MSLESISQALASFGISHVVVAASAKRAMDYDPQKIKTALKTYKLISKNDLDYKILKTGDIVLVTRDTRAEFSPEIKTAKELDKYLKALIRSAEAQGTEEVDAKSPPRQVTLKFKSSSERARARREAKQYRLRNKAKLRLKAKKYAMKMKHRKPNPILSKRAKQVHKKYGY